MFVARIENARHQTLNLSQNERDFQIIRISGLNPPRAQINRSMIAGMDGSRVNSTKLEDRNIVIELALNGNVEANRLRLYSLFPVKEWCKFYFANATRDVYIEGYVELNEIELFAMKEIMQISIICADPYFKALDEIVDDISKELGLFEFPFAIDSNGIEFSTIDTSKITKVTNRGEIETGLNIEIEIFGTVNKIEVKSVTTGETFGLSYAFKEHDMIFIDTNKGHKSATLVRDAQRINLIGATTPETTFMQLQVGENHFSYLADGGNSDSLVYVIFKHNTLYRGV